MSAYVSRPVGSSSRDSSRARSGRAVSESPPAGSGSRPVAMASSTASALSCTTASSRRNVDGFAVAMPVTPPS